MGCHTWFYKRLDRNIETAIKLAINEIKTLSNNIDVNMFKSKLELKKYKNEMNLLLEKLNNTSSNKMSEGLKDIIYNFQPNKELIIYIKDIGPFICTDELPHDLFRTDYTNDILLSKEQTFIWLEKNKDNIYGQLQDYEQRLITFWDMYPNGLIEFG